MHFSLFKFTFFRNPVFSFMELLVFELLFGISEAFLLVCSVPAYLAQTVLLLVSLQLLMFPGTLMYSKPGSFVLIICHMTPEMQNNGERRNRPLRGNG
jgi:hypothetical protein